MIHKIGRGLSLCVSFLAAFKIPLILLILSKTFLKNPVSPHRFMVLFPGVRELGEILLLVLPPIFGLGRRDGL